MLECNNAYSTVLLVGFYILEPIQTYPAPNPLTKFNPMLTSYYIHDHNFYPNLTAFNLTARREWLPLALFRYIRLG